MCDQFLSNITFSQDVRILIRLAERKASLLSGRTELVFVAARTPLIQTLCRSPSTL
jgi:hypothetical protein